METTEQLMAMIEKLKADNAALKAKKDRKLSVKVSEKGAVCIYGLNRFPVTLYKNQWEKVIAFIPELQAFLEANKDKLVSKDDVKAIA